MNNATLTFSEAQYTAATTLESDGLEDVSYCIASRYDTSKGIHLVVREVMKPAADQLNRSRYSVEPSPEFLCSMYSELKASGCNVIVQSHTHPFTAQPHFSSQDDASARGLLFDTKSVHANGLIVQIVYGRQLTQHSARVIHNVSKSQKLGCIRIVGPRGREEVGEADSHIPTMATHGDRNVLAFGASGAGQISALNVLLIGASGLGSGIAFMLTRIGVRSMVICDMDRIDGSNLNRMYLVSHGGSAIGRNKAHFVCKELRRFDPKGNYTPLQANVIAEDVILPHLKSADIVLQAVDNEAARLVMNRLCARYAKPLVNVSNAITLENGTITGAQASCQWFLPGEPDYPCLECAGGLDIDAAVEGLRSPEYRAMRERAGYVVGTDQSPAPQVVPINSIAAATAVWQIAGWAAGVHSPPPWTYHDSVTNTLRTMTPAQNDECTSCSLSHRSSFAAGESDQAPLSTPSNADIRLQKGRS